MIGIPIICSCIFIYAYLFMFLNIFNYRTYEDFHIFYYQKHLLRKKSFLNIVYLGKKCDERHPHLDSFSISFLLGFIIVISSWIYAFFNIAIGQSNNLILLRIGGVYSLCGILFVICSGALIAHFQSLILKKEWIS